MPLLVCTGMPTVDGGRQRPARELNALISATPKLKKASLLLGR